MLNTWQLEDRFEFLFSLVLLLLSLFIGLLLRTSLLTLLMFLLFTRVNPLLLGTLLGRCSSAFWARCAFSFALMVASIIFLSLPGSMPYFLAESSSQKCHSAGD